MFSNKFMILAIAAIIVFVVVYFVARTPRTRALPPSHANANTNAGVEMSELATALKTYHPDVWTEIKEVGPEAELETYTLASDFLLSLSPQIAAAPDHVIVDLIRAHADLISQLASEDVEACAYVHYYGPQDVESYSAEAKARTDRLGALTVIAAHEGAQNPTERSGPFPAPTLPFDEEDPPAPEQVCGHILDLYQQLLAMPPADAARAFIGLKYAD